LLKLLRQGLAKQNYQEAAHKKDYFRNASRATKANEHGDIRRSHLVRADFELISFRTTKFSIHQ